MDELAAWKSLNQYVGGSASVEHNHIYGTSDVDGSSISERSRRIAPTSKMMVSLTCQRPTVKTTHSSPLHLLQRMWRDKDSASKVRGRADERQVVTTTLREAPVHA